MDTKAEDIIYIYGITHGEFSKSINGVYEDITKIYIKSNSSNIICEGFETVVINNKTILLCKYNIVNEALSFESDIEIYYNKNIIGSLHIKYIVDEDKTDEFDIVPDDLYFESGKSTIKLKSNIVNDLYKYVRVLSTAPWCYANICDDSIDITVEENPYEMERKCFMEYYINYNGVNERDVVVITQDKKITKK